MLSPLFSTAQNSLPRFENDTLYTSGGYKIYKGQVLQLANGTSEAGYFRFIKFHSNMARTDTYNLQNSSLVVDKLKNYKVSQDNYSIRVQGTVTYKDGRRADIDIIMDFEKATESLAGQPAELTVPEEFRNKQPATVATPPKNKETVAAVKKQNAPAELKNLLIADEIKKLFDLYKAGALTKEEYEAQKKKLLARQ